jgi:hypothetical protein
MIGFWQWLGSLPPSSASFVGSLTGASVGLIALVLGALFNAYLNRRRDDRLLTIDRTVLATALNAELASIHKTLSENARSLTDNPPDPKGGFLVPDVAHSVQVLPHVLSKIGLLDPVPVRKVMDAYILVNQYFDSILMLGGDMQKDTSRDRRIAIVPPDRTKYVIGLNTSNAEMIAEALASLQPHLKKATASGRQLWGVKLRCAWRKVRGHSAIAPAPTACKGDADA